MATTTLVRLATRTENVASGLYVFRDNLPLQAPRITAIIGELFNLSASLQQIDEVYHDGRCHERFSLLKDDARLVYATIQHTLEAVLGSFSRCQTQRRDIVWEELTFQMEAEEHVGLLKRIRYYRDYLRELFRALTDRRSSQFHQLRACLVDLLEAQEETRRLSQIAVLADVTGTPHSSATPVPGRSRAMSGFWSAEIPTSPTYPPWDYSARPPPPAPEPPLPMSPTSPTFTTSSSQSFPSSRTSYSNGYFPQQNTSGHWASKVFDGKHPIHTFPRQDLPDDRCKCYGDMDNSAQERLSHERFVKVLQLSFDRETFWVLLYHRPEDDRARIMIMTRTASCCLPLTSLKIIRSKAALHLCRVQRSGNYILWAKIYFPIYEKMVLYYSTFVAMKNQDRCDIDHIDLQERFELNEDQEYGGILVQDGLIHALRLFRDRTTGAIRLEASAYRGPMENVPIWTAFLTKYKKDPDHFHLEREGVVSIAALRPPPYVFVDGFQPRRNSRGDFELVFGKPTDARDFIVTWNALCRNSD